MRLEEMIDLNKILVEVSNRHVHLSKDHLEILFGKHYQLAKKKMLSQPGQFASEETVTLKYNGYEIKDVRILGPTRQQTQVEISATDSHYFRINDGQRVSLFIPGKRPVTYHDIITRTGPIEKTALAVHLDSDEGNSVL